VESFITLGPGVLHGVHGEDDDGESRGGPEPVYDVADQVSML
jgi:hypothetical protein